MKKKKCSQFAFKQSTHHYDCLSLNKAAQRGMLKAKLTNVSICFLMQIHVPCEANEDMSADTDDGAV